MSIIFRYNKEEHMRTLRTLTRLDTSAVHHMEDRAIYQSAVEYAINKDVEGFWNPSPSPIKPDEDDSSLKVVSTDISMSLKGPSLALRSNPEEFKKQARLIKRDIRRLSTYSKKNIKQKIKNPNPLGPVGGKHGRRSTEHLEYQRDFFRRLAIEDGRDFLLDFLRYHFEDHLDSISIKGKKTLEEIKMIGNEELQVGVRQCRRLFNAPVLSDKIGLLLWTELRKGESLDHSHEFRSDDEDLMAHVKSDDLKKKETEHLEQRLAEYIAAQSLLVSPGSDHTVSNEPTNTKEATIIKESVVNDARKGGATPVATTRAQRGPPSILMEKKALDGFLNGMKQRTARGAIYFAASLATGYA